MAVLIVLLNILLGVGVVGSFMNESGSPATFLILLAIFDPLLIFFVTVLRRERFFGEMSFRITTKRAYILAPSTVNQKIILLNQFDLRTDWTRGDGDYYFLPLETIRLLAIRANTGVRQYFGLKQHDIFLCTSSQFGSKGTYKFSQVSGIPTVVNALIRNLNFSRINPYGDMKGMECYLQDK